MKCEVCRFESNCSLREEAKDITGCEGHSKSKYEDGKLVQCIACKEWVCDAMNWEDGTYICYGCY